ncbi:rhamnogalacturonan acetylesterase [Undibacterium sp. 14-3-2]|uniref:rhamnogalacturonan acetylesterase n=1 Tax=Undibacterium sp. 14-3-2 TaxID=2800129 RepID=UPI001F35385B|nr:rhamnogalacturonan acetylesterase [Undibacterium sp. 14-3-2]
MKTLLRVVLLACSAPLWIACQGMAPVVKDSPPLEIILVGDSTMAPNSGYGNALCERFLKEVTCLNLAKGGRSSGSYRAEGSWEIVMQQLRRDTDKRRVVLMQFGHNDQPGKPGRSTDLATEFPVNLARYVDEVRATGAEIILLTPLTRRTFKDGVLPNDLRPWAEASLRIASEKQVPAIDLNQQSHALVAAMGQSEADTLAMVPPPPEIVAPTSGSTLATVERQGAAKSAFDRTHVGKKGAAIFSEMVVQALVAVDPEIGNGLDRGSSK